MRKLQLDFRQGRSGSWLGWSLLAAGLLLALQTTAAHRAMTDERSRAEAALARTGETVSRPGAAISPPPGAVVSAPDLAEMKRISAEMRLPWNALFNQLEALKNQDIALLSLAPDARSKQLRLSAEARNLDAMLRFHRQLEQSPELSDVSLLRHEVVTQVAEQPIRFDMLASWVIDHAAP